MEKMFQVGVITTPHGVHGEVKVFPTTDDARRFKKLKQVLIDDGKRSLEIESVKFFKQFAILKFKDIDTMDDAQKLRQKSLMIERKDAVKLQKDEYFKADLLGMDIYDEEEKQIGTLTNILETGANDVYEIELTDGRSFLLPAIKQCVLEVRPEENYMRIHILEGLLEE